MLNSDNICLVCGDLQTPRFEYQGYYYHQCQTCGLVSTYPLPEEQVVEEHYSHKFIEGNYRLLQDYAEQYRSVYQTFTEVLSKTMKGQGGALTGTSILDIGCFTGEFLELLQAAGADVFGLELQAEAVAIANERLPGRVYKADFFGAEFPQREFDAITLMGVIEHVVDPVSIIKRTHQLLKSEGLIMLQTPNSGALLARLLGKHWPPYQPVEHIHLFSERSLQRLLIDTGFEDIHITNHVKRLPVAYVYAMMANFGTELRKIVAPFYNLLPQAARNVQLPFYIGEMIVTARKSSAQG
jgi:2-polyprenyl-3-methyl-5-hydroxy-6-metoxy-1,4-benzoquinol methylase